MGENSVGEFYSVAVTTTTSSRDRIEDDHIGKNTRSTIIERDISRSEQQQLPGPVRITSRAENARNFSSATPSCWDKCGAHTFPYIDVATERGIVDMKPRPRRYRMTSSFIASSGAFDTEKAYRADRKWLR